MANILYELEHPEHISYYESESRVVVRYSDEKTFAFLLKIPAEEFYCRIRNSVSDMQYLVVDVKAEINGTPVWLCFFTNTMPKSWKYVKEVLGL